jgi:hypothetical protein
MTGTSLQTVFHIVNVFADGDAVSVSIADTGPGMSPQVAERAFDAFFSTRPMGRSVTPLRPCYTSRRERSLSSRKFVRHWTAERSSCSIGSSSNLSSQLRIVFSTTPWRSANVSS